MNIKLKGMLFSLILILSSTLVIGICYYYQFKSMMVNEVNESAVRVAQSAADHLNNYINQFVSPLIGLAEEDKIISMDWEQQKKVIEAQIYPQYLKIAVVNKEGKAHYIDDVTLDVSDQNYIQKTLKGNVTFSEVIISNRTGSPVIMVGVPIKKNDHIVGALIARIDVDFLSNYAVSNGYGENGRTYILSNTGSFIARPDQEKTQGLYNLYDTAIVNNKFDSFMEFVKTTKENESGYGKYEFNGKNLFMGYASVKQTNWKIYIGTYESDVFEGLVNLKKMIFILTAIISAICTIIAWFIIGKFTKPIVELDKLFSQGAMGNLTIRFTPKTKDEIGRLGISFNRMMDKIKTLTQYDPLTSLLNQYALEKDVDALIHSENICDFSLIMVAVNKFSFINETFGYKSGDAILAEAAKRISNFSLECNKIYRYKGDKLVILYKDNYDKNAIDAYAKIILETLSESYQINEKILAVNISIGLFTWNEDTRAENPLHAVTHAKNYAKYLGENQIQKFDRELYNKMTVLKELQADILKGLKENQFFIVYQPLFYLYNESIAEVETLIRWNHPEKGLLYPGQFIDLAESTGTIISIDKWVLDTACKQLMKWKKSGKKPVMLSINISSKTFETKSFITDLLTIIDRYDVDPTLLQLEITERMVIKNVEESISKLQKLRTMGIRIAIDDFGIGYSSFSYIVRLPIDSIKIDKSFIKDIQTSKEQKVIVSTIITLCKALNLNVIAEGIESELELEYLKRSNCDIGQGYYFSKPIDITEFEKKHFN